MRTVKRKYHYFYKITNNLNNHYYYGIHSTDNLDDGYMGSGTRLRYAYEKYGIEGLKDKRGHHKSLDEMSELERLRAENKLLKAEKERAEMEISFLKKLEEIERRWD